MQSKFGFGKEIACGADEAVEKVTHALKAEGFGVLADIDVAAKINKELNADMRPYRILGACNPVLANKAISEVPDIGLLLPCNVLVRSIDDDRTEISFMDPEGVLSLVDHPLVAELAADVKARLTRVQDAL
jgi:uncharacterized protein (DUF302 family)